MSDNILTKIPPMHSALFTRVGDGPTTVEVFDLKDKALKDASPMTNERSLTPEEQAMIQTWPGLNNHVKALDKWIDRIEDICYDKAMSDREKLLQIAGVIDVELPRPVEPECQHPWVEPETGRCLGCGNTVNREGKPT